MSKINILVVDDHSLVREGIITMLSIYEDFNIIGDAESGEQALEKIAEEKPDVMLLDINMPGMNGIETAKKVLADYGGIRIIILSMEVTQDHISEAIKAGVAGYLAKDTKKEVLAEAIRKVMEGEQYFGDKISEVIFKGFYKQSKGEQVAKENKDLSKREVEVLRQIASGLSNREIADKLFISIRTVDAHRNHIMQKLSMKSTAQLVKYAIKEKIIDLE
ncbi:DNA-binding response regulator, NarL/FixJ family, contains REC and HTH domains [Reichenbachiella agariperforans]|uniref:DNA-binding response regulator, NarL/FixJ family, contains REC and HTH domains n=1 Tax=Reichenbachiella agariperforans TaxID=156994 RepID=A0A1M6W963_REIAG|nr:response regulator transcription factor [Reichenbachiella agariperforans]SHK90227.1 DNA-binding response regulator, NarL/FixJ family, contains REC and HTH domains [Reichenbachiella agariperforans]